MILWILLHFQIHCRIHCIWRSNEHRTIGFYGNILDNGILVFHIVLAQFVSIPCFDPMHWCHIFNVKSILIRILWKMVCNSMLFLLQNFHTTTLPQSKNGRLIREKYQPTPPPSYKSVEYALNGIELILMYLDNCKELQRDFLQNWNLK